MDFTGVWAEDHPEDQSVAKGTQSTPFEDFRPFRDNGVSIAGRHHFIKKKVPINVS